MPLTIIISVVLACLVIAGAVALGDYMGRRAGKRIVAARERAIARAHERILEHVARAFDASEDDA